MHFRANSMLNKILYKKNLILIVIVILLYVFYKFNIKYLSIEDLAICSGIGCDLIKSGQSIEYKISTSIYNLETENKISSYVITSKDNSIPGTREKRQHWLNRKFIFGLEKILLCSDAFAYNGINNLIDSLFHNKDVNDIAYMIVCSGNAEDIMKLKIPGYISSSDYIFGMIERADEFTFYSPNYKFIDAYVRVISEGRNFVTPHISLTKEGLIMDGSSIFNKDKMISTLNMEETKIMNILREQGGRGVITLKYEGDNYIDFYGTNKRKIKCTKTDKGFVFKISVLLDGEIASNTTNYNLSLNPEKIKAIEKEFEAKVKKDCEAFIGKMKNTIKTDCLELGSVGVSVYGRRKNIDWNKEVLNSTIEVDVKVKISGLGRGDY